MTIETVKIERLSKQEFDYQTEIYKRTWKTWQFFLQKFKGSK